MSDTKTIKLGFDIDGAKMTIDQAKELLSVAAAIYGAASDQYKTIRTHVLNMTKDNLARFVTINRDGR